ncbi:MULTISPECIES: HlyD family efflux transporter periplasmic adaptor subunit [Bacillaceae]|uniref:efflux RND transporter periplasmic adaptor subunit n=1 Tax=Bacillaceae TaxID=186817 RepID=UPI001E50A960|nr:MULTISPECIES: HlyD family efflux transporter periplasmic adaptor subunit [Bacillaceae]MCE4051341.1 efflux RND transporter periplasmic adaptor subunit [Bacillus sp. Au-Bac7]UPO88685.1 efflux RND transporter periplasmic adaptor subunit [Niallia sp. Man26]
MSKGKILLINFIGLVVILGLIALGAYFYYQNKNYVKTDDAVVSADITEIVAPTSGVLTSWNGEAGKDLNKKESVGKVSSGKTASNVNSMEAGTIIKNEAKANELVQAGQVLAQTADMDHMYVLANIKETELKDIEIGDNVDITVDGDSDVMFDGKIEDISYATNSVFSALPSQNATGNYTKVTQKVQVKISIQNPTKKVLLGMNAEVKISI